MKNPHILRVLTTGENWFIDSITIRKLKYFGLIKNHRVLERTVMESVATGSQGGDPSAGTREQDTEDTLGTRLHDTG